MNYFASIQKFLLFFLVLAIILPISSIFLFLWGTILAHFGDTGGSTFLYGLTTASVALWFLSLTGILLLLAIDRLMIRSE